MPERVPAEVLAAYDLGEVTAAQSLEGGMFLRPVLLTTTRGRFVWRAQSFGGAARLEVLGEVLDRAAAAGVRCPRILRNRAGQFATSGQGTVHAIHEYLPGRLYDWSEWLEAKGQPGFLERLGAAVARVHNALAAIVPAGDATLDIAMPPIQFHALESIRAQWDAALDGLGSNPVSGTLRGLRRPIAAAWEFLITGASARGVNAIPRQLVHGDLSPVNLVFSEPDGELGLIDWDCLHGGLRLYDALGDVLNRPPLALAGSFAVEWDNIRRYLDGYAAAAATPLAPAETACVPLFLVARQLEDLRQRVHVLAALPEERHAEYAVIAATRVRLALDIIKDQPPI
jgi:Ser/Thr protein kinase RdoA (MazF antagonist)